MIWDALYKNIRKYQKNAKLNVVFLKINSRNLAISLERQKYIAADSYVSV